VYNYQSPPPLCPDRYGATGIARSFRQSIKNELSHMKNAHGVRILSQRARPGGEHVGTVDMFIQRVRLTRIRHEEQLVVPDSISIESNVREKGGLETDLFFSHI
jgi:hypothetical protein